MIPNDHKIYQHLPLKESPKLTQIGIFGLKINHLANLCERGQNYPLGRTFIINVTRFFQHELNIHLGALHKLTETEHNKAVSFLRIKLFSCKSDTLERTDVTPS
jgi:hypothetical protein